MTTPTISRIEAIILYVTFGLLIFGIIMSRLDRFWFEFTYVVEDGFIEWMTVLAVLIMLVTSTRRFINLSGHRSKLFLMILAAFTFLCFFVAGEELSWGQRLLGRKSSEFFARYNSQKETNFHNLVVAGKSVNLIVFSRLLILAMVFYLIILPVLYSRSNHIKQLADGAGIPIPKFYQIISILLVFGLIALCPSGKRSELLEFGTCFMLVSIVLFPKNKEIFTLNS